MQYNTIQSKRIGNRRHKKAGGRARCLTPRKKEFKWVLEIDESIYEI